MAKANKTTEVPKKAVKEVIAKLSEWWPHLKIEEKEPGQINVWGPTVIMWSEDLLKLAKLTEGYMITLGRTGPNFRMILKQVKN